MQIKEDLPPTPQREELTKITQEEPETGTRINQEYAEQEIGRELRNLASRKANGSDGIPGEALKATRKWPITPITRIMGAVKQEIQYRKTGPTGQLYTYTKQRMRRGKWELQAYIPKANYIQNRSGLITRKLTKIIRILARNNQFGHKEGISTIDAIIKIEQYRPCQPWRRDPAHEPLQCVRYDKQDAPLRNDAQERNADRDDQSH